MHTERPCERCPVRSQTCLIVSSLTKGGRRTVTVRCGQDRNQKTWDRSWLNLRSDGPCLGSRRRVFVNRTPVFGGSRVLPTCGWDLRGSSFLRRHPRGVGSNHEISRYLLSRVPLEKRRDGKKRSFKTSKPTKFRKRFVLLTPNFLYDRIF